MSISKAAPAIAPETVGARHASPLQAPGAAQELDQTTARRGGGQAVYVLRPTISNGALLERGSDRRFRALVNHLFTVASRMEVVRAHLGRRMGISGPQYSVLVAVAHLQGERGAGAGRASQQIVNGLMPGRSRLAGMLKPVYVIEMQDGYWNLIGTCPAGS